MTIQHNPKHTRRAQELRKNATRQENHLWYDFLRQCPVQFRRQVTIDRFIVDFYCAAASLVIEVDGSQHYTEEGMAYDAERTAILNGLGLAVLRLSNRDIDTQFRGVCEYIHQILTLRLGRDPYDQL